MIDYTAKNIKYLMTKGAIHYESHFGVKKTTIISYREGKTDPPVNVILNICKHFAITPDHLILLDIEKEGGLDAIKEKYLKGNVKILIGDKKTDSCNCASSEALIMCKKLNTFLEKENSRLEARIKELESITTVPKTNKQIK